MATRLAAEGSSGGHGVRIERRADLESGFGEALAQGGPAMVEVATAARAV